jgi:hypothetical protein
MSAVSPARQADITDYADDSPSRNKNSVALAPNLFEFVYKGLIVVNQTKLVLTPLILLQIPIRRRGEDKMNTVIVDKTQISAVSVI